MGRAHQWKLLAGARPCELREKARQSEQLSRARPSELMGRARQCKLMAGAHPCELRERASQSDQLSRTCPCELSERARQSEQLGSWHCGLCGVPVEWRCS